MDDPQSRVNGDTDGSKKSAVPSRYQQFMTSEDEADSSSAHSSDEEEEEEEVEKDGTTVTSTSVPTVLPPVKDEALVSSAPVSESGKVWTDILDMYLSDQIITECIFSKKSNVLNIYLSQVVSSEHFLLSNYKNSKNSKDILTK